MSEIITDKPELFIGDKYNLERIVMVRIKVKQGEFVIYDGVYTGPSELEGLFDIVRQRDVATWEGPNDYAYAMRMVGDDPYEILEYDEDEPAGINQAPA